MNITFAFALNKENNFGKEHFGNSDKFALYTYKNNLISLNDELQNSIKSMDELQEHGSKMKGNAIISFLKENKVSVLVSKQFGQNIKLGNQHFIPVIINEDKPEMMLEILLKHIDWFKDELINRNENFMLFKIRNGIIKMHI